MKIEIAISILAIGIMLWSFESADVSDNFRLHTSVLGCAPAGAHILINGLRSHSSMRSAHSERRSKERCSLKLCKNVCQFQLFLSRPVDNFIHTSTRIYGIKKLPIISDMMRPTNAMNESAFRNPSLFIMSEPFYMFRAQPRPLHMCTCNDNSGNFAFIIISL